jgi:hypothetical protein
MTGSGVAPDGEATSTERKLHVGAWSAFLPSVPAGMVPNVTKRDWLASTVWRCRTKPAAAWLQGFDGVPMGSDLRPDGEGRPAQLPTLFNRSRDPK